MKQSRTTRGVAFLLGALTVMAAIGSWYLLSNHQRRGDDRSQLQQTQEVPLPPFTESHLLNTGADARYIGTAACAGCHKDQHQSYSLTAHSRALSDVDPHHEPPDGSFTHPASGRSYRVYRRDGKLRHEEALSTADGHVIARVDLPVRYRIGSGRHARSYAVEVEGFLHESPLTWYAATNKWGMSPGYDSANHGSFERPIVLECLACHAGRVEEAGGAINRLTVTEKAIGCESCHGPGSVHQELHRNRKLAPGEADVTIVHPGKLSRTLQEAICSSCHLSGPAVAPVRGRQISDFRPGHPLSDYRIHYRLQGSSDPMTVVGHVEQLHLSACYQKSPALTCVSCHDPHERSEPIDRIAFFRKRCLTCHETQPCKLAPVQRRLKEPMDNCVSCHMPRGNTEVPHVASTHHRIGLHPLAQSPGPRHPPDLVPVDEPLHLSQPDRERTLGLAYQTARRNPAAPYAAAFGERARTHLEGAYAGGLRDAETVIGLAELFRRVDGARAFAYAREGLTASDASPRARVRALTIIAHGEFQKNNVDRAIPALEELTRLQRFADDWRMLGLCYLRQNALEKAAMALKTALEIRPFRSSTHIALAEAYERLGRTQLAAEHRETARRLRLSNQD